METQSKLNLYKNFIRSLKGRLSALCRFIVGRMYNGKSKLEERPT